MINKEMHLMNHDIIVTKDGILYRIDDLSDYLNVRRESVLIFVVPFNNKPHNTRELINRGSVKCKITKETHPEYFL